MYLNPWIVTFPECVHERRESDDVSYRPPPRLGLPHAHLPVSNWFLLLATACTNALRVCPTPDVRSPESEFFRGLLENQTQVPFAIGSSNLKLHFASQNDPWLHCHPHIPTRIGLNNNDQSAPSVGLAQGCISWEWNLRRRRCSTDTWQPTNTVRSKVGCKRKNCRVKPNT